MQVINTAYGSTIEPPQRWTFWREATGKRFFLLIDYYLHPDGPDKSHIWLKEIVAGKLQAAKQVNWILFAEQIEKGLLKECGVVVG